MGRGKVGTLSISHATPNQEFFLTKQYWAHLSLEEALISSFAQFDVTMQDTEHGQNVHKPSRSMPQADVEGWARSGAIMNNSNSESWSCDTHYIVFVHGTWATHDGEKRPWYGLNKEDPNSFAASLHRLLEKGQLGDARWGEDTVYTWSGENSHDARLQAGRELCQVLLSIIKKDGSARIHLIAHSHGGNVVLAALSEYLREIHAVASDFDNLMVGSGDPRAELQIALDNLRIREKSKTLYWLLYSRLFDEAGTRDAPLGAHDFLCVANRVGRVVFLGTPFYILKSNPPGLVRAWLYSLLEGMLVIVVAVPVILLLLTAPVTLFLGIWMLVSPSWKVEYHDLLLSFSLPILVVSVPFGIIMMISRFFSRLEWERESNVYLDREAAQYKESIEALCVSAGLLDEVYLALSAYPILESYFLLKLEQLRPKFQWDKFRKPPGATEEMPIYAMSVLWFFGQIRRNFWRFILRYPYRFVAERFVVRELRRLLFTAVTGMPSEQIWQTRMYVSALPESSRILRTIKWSIADLLLDDQQRLNHSETQLAGEGGSSRRERYRFLYDPNERDLRKSVAWYEALQHMEGITASSARRAPSNRGDLGISALAIDARLRELQRQVTLNHSQYYSNETVIEAIAAFLESGKRPS